MATATHVLRPRRAGLDWSRGEDGAGCLDRYLESRRVYKHDLVEELVSVAGSGQLLEVSNGLGGLGVELLTRTSAELHSICESDAARRLYAEKLRRAGVDRRCRLHVANPWRLPAESFATTWSVSVLHEWERPRETIRALHAATAAGGLVLIDDLRRDADPFITEYVLRELAGDETDGPGFRARAFARSLSSAYTVDELRELLVASAVGPFELDAQPMTVTARIRGG
jgi:SAM-dependent methyltransferase